jgi:membrane-bound serine protease (ClpP class)
MKHGFCEGMAESIPEVLAMNGITDYELKNFEPTPIDNLIGWLINPAISGILIMIIIGGIYFELQTPGVGFPLAAAVTAATLYFAPLYLEGLAENWEIILFLAGLVFIGIEIIVLPGFGVAGVAGIALVLTGLTLSLVNNVGFDFEMVMPNKLITASLTVILGLILGLFGSISLARKFLTSTMMSNVVLTSIQRKEDGFIGIDASESALVGHEGIAFTILRPSGKVEIEGELYDATALNGFIEKGEQIKVVKHEMAQLFVKKV